MSNLRLIDENVDLLTGRKCVDRMLSSDLADRIICRSQIVSAFIIHESCTLLLNNVIAVLLSASALILRGARAPLTTVVARLLTESEYIILSSSSSLPHQM